MKTYPNMPATTIRVLYEPSSSDMSALDTYWESIGIYFSESPKYLDAGAYYVNFFDNDLFQVGLLFPNKTPDEVNSLTQSWFDGLRTLNITPTISEIVQRPTVRDASTVVYEVNDGGILVGTDLFGARILPKRLWEEKEGLSTLLNTLRKIVNENGQILDVGINPTNEILGNPNNAVLPAFRSMHSMCMVIWYILSSLVRCAKRRSLKCLGNGMTLRAGKNSSLGQSPLHA